MILNLCLITPNRIVWNSEVQEVILSTNSGQIGILPNHAPLLTALDIGVMKVRVNEQWLNMALMGGFATIENNNINVLVNEAEVAIDINPEEARNTFFQNKTNLARAKGKKEAIEADLALKRSKARLEALN